ncbi:hypothetical protein D3C79_1030900 [compost metagenome]
MCQLLVQTCDLILQYLHSSTLILQEFHTDLQPSSDLFGLLILGQHHSVGVLRFIQRQLWEQQDPFLAQDA